MEPVSDWPFSDLQVLGDTRVIELAKDQSEYRPLTVVAINGDLRGPRVSRWTFTAEERQLIAAGADLFIDQLTFGMPFHPILPSLSLHEIADSLGIDQPLRGNHHTHVDDGTLAADRERSLPTNEGAKRAQAVGSTTEKLDGPPLA
jgi:hypothetical protein